MRTGVKICGLTRAEDVALASALGARALGVVLAPSPRQVTVEKAAAILAHGAPDTLRVGVFVDPEPDLVADAVAACRLDCVQLSGNETAQHTRAIADRIFRVVRHPVRLMKAVHVSSAEDPWRYGAYPADMFLLDAAAVDGRMGGMGNRFPWSHAADLPWPRARLWLAGGLNAANVAEAVQQLRPAFVDVSSGVEDAPGRKSAAKMTAFLAAVAGAAATLEEAGTAPTGAAPVQKASR